jgi:hypothetical protein
MLIFLLSLSMNTPKPIRMNYFFVLQIRSDSTLSFLNHHKLFVHFCNSVLSVINILTKGELILAVSNKLDISQCFK